MRNRVVIFTLLFVLTLFTFACRSSGLLLPENSASEKKYSSAPTPASPLQANEKSGAKNNDLRIILSGTWRQENVKDCYCNPCLNVQFEKDDENFCVQFAQATVSAYYNLDEENKKLYIYFKKPTDLGRGGTGLEWKKFDRRKPIAVIDVSKAKEKEISLNWLGFAYKKSNRREIRYGSQYEGVYKKE